MTSAAETAGRSATTTKPATNIAPLFAGLMVTMLLSSLNQTILSTALPTIVGELHGIDKMSWVITSYILASTITMPLYGRLSDLLGRKPLLILAILLFIAGSVLGALAGTVNWLIASRAIQGFGAGGLMLLSQTAIADVVPARERGRYMGVMGSVFAVSSVAGPLLGGWLTEGPGWRWAFWLNIPLGIVAVVSTAVFLKLPKKTRDESFRVDYLGMALLAALTTMIVLVCTWGGSSFEWTSPTILAMIGGSLLLVTIFVVTETYAKDPIIPLSLFRDRNFTLTTIASLLTGVAMFGTIGYMPTYIQMVSGVSATEAGLLMIPMMASLLVTSIVAGQIVSRTGRYKFFPIVGSAIMGLGLFLLSTLDVDSPMPLLCGYLAVLGTGIGLGMQILTLIVQNSVPGRIVGTAMSTNNYFRQVGATIGSAVVGSVFVGRLTESLRENFAGAGTLAGVPDHNSLTPGAVSALPEPARHLVLESYNYALLPIFLYMVPLAILSLLVMSFAKEIPLATTIENEAVVEGLAEGQLVVGEQAGTPAKPDPENGVGQAGESLSSQNGRPLG